MLTHKLTLAQKTVVMRHTEVHLCVSSLPVGEESLHEFLLLLLEFLLLLLQPLLLLPQLLFLAEADPEWGGDNPQVNKL